MAKVFRLRFRLPYQSFLNLSEEIERHELFKYWIRVDAVGDAPSNRKLLILRFLRFIGRAWTLDDICEVNGISIDAMNGFISCFMEYGSTILYKK